MKYKKRPIVVDAFQWLGIQAKPEFPEWLTSAFQAGDAWLRLTSSAWIAELIIMINTLEGKSAANVGDWIIQGVEGEIYPCKPSIFEKTYEPVEEPTE